MGLSLFVSFIGNIQSILQGLNRRNTNMLTRYNEVEQWSRHCRLPKKLRRRILEAEIQNRITTRGMKEEELMKNMPEDIQRDLTRHWFFSVIKKVTI
ncbi:probable cyclic nucleotide-gated ion channel 20, chloroplastic [Arachis stenosperma]|uniref:probable cyclic nucleotide-gated ion channel 20, chloroplastic n=1 Tax=Arachis stenosperma TaxID=217475 RepID=UPI0025AC9099|nr:probable cyclic nucleotide-gated ion channel 20, chloroplastic [Arachis stenosperma]